MGLSGLIYVIIPNLMTIDKTIAEMPLFSTFMMAAVHHLGFFKVQNLNCRVNMPYASSCQISCRSVNTWRYIIFKIASSSILNLL